MCAAVAALLRFRGKYAPAALLAVAVGAASVAALGRDASARGPQRTDDALPLAFTGLVARVNDGDTFNVRVEGKERRIRMASIDAPEITKNPQRPGQAYSQASRDALAKLIRGKSVKLRCFEKDHYDRYVCDAALGEGMTVNQMQVANGMAWVNMERKGQFMRDPKLPALQEEAKRKRLGLWQESDPVRPWVWRYQCWQQQQC